MEITTAREIITQAKADDTYDGPMPEDDATAISTAQEIVQMAEQAWVQNIRSAEVEKILNLASGGNGYTPDAGDDEPVADPEDLSEFPENLTKMEPWEEYGDGRVSDITEGINYYLENEPDSVPELLRHVWAYEQSHKRRVRILEHVQKAGERVGIQIGSKSEGESKPTGGRSTSGVEEGAGVSEESGAEVPAQDEESGTGGIPSDESRLPEEHQEGQEATPADAPTEPKPEAPAQGEESRDGEHEGEPPAENRPEGSGGGVQALVERVENELRNERLDGIPTPPEEKAPELPWRWADISDSDLRDYLMQFASLAYYKSYVYSRDERIALHCKEAADTLRNELMVKIDKYDSHNKEKKVGLIEAEIESDENVRRWRRLQRRYEAMAQSAKREMESYHKVYEALSRLETMRHNSWERARR